MSTRGSPRSTSKRATVTSEGSIRAKRPDPKHRNSSGLSNVIYFSEHPSPQGPKDSADKQTTRTSEKSLISQFEATEKAVKELIGQVEGFKPKEVYDQLKDDLEYELQYNLVGIRTSGVLQEFTELHEINGLRRALRDRQIALEGLSNRLEKLPEDSQKEKEKAKKEIIKAIKDILTKPLETANEIKENLDKQKG